MRDCERCINAKPYGGPQDNRCSAWSCEFIDRAEAKKIYNEYKNGGLIVKDAETNRRTLNDIKSGKGLAPIKMEEDE